MDQPKKRDEALDAVKGFAILLVMLGHCIVLNNLADPYLYDGIAAVQMPLFMAVSGFTAGGRGYFLPEGKPDLKKRLSVLGRRTVSYLLPFFMWLWITHIKNPLSELKLQLFALDRGLWFLMTLWIVTLTVMAAAYAADFGAWKSGWSVKGKGLLRFLIFGALISAGWMGFVIWGRSGNTFLSPSLTVKYLPFYAAGYLWRLYIIPAAGGQKEEEAKRHGTVNTEKGSLRHGTGDGKNRKEHAIVNMIWLLTAAAFIYLIAAFDMIEAASAKALLIQMAASFLGSFVCFYGIYHFVKGKLRRCLAFTGQYTLEIYVLHFRFARLLGIGEKGLTLYSIEAVGWVLAAFAVMSLLTAACIYLIKKVWLLDLLLFGKRKNK